MNTFSFLFDSSSGHTLSFRTRALSCKKSFICSTAQLLFQDVTLKPLDDTEQLKNGWLICRCVILASDWLRLIT
mgnify:FL=1